ncbi:hypothetical protein SASPL_145440 [Salvia splendens]|uniref:Pectinesterase n=1 Tax=Salvia splendens TaxID=180675 RepID=A0A8X8WHQ2_SALSN|nr:hypothetical protein SASPL_145440 [Salvia splendens]
MLPPHSRCEELVGMGCRREDVANPLPKDDVEGTTTKNPTLILEKEVQFPNQTESCHLDLEFEEADDVVFSVIGPRSVYLIGYYIHQNQQFGHQSDSESYGVDIQNSQTEESSYQTNDGDKRRPVTMKVMRVIMFTKEMKWMELKPLKIWILKIINWLQNWPLTNNSYNYPPKRTRNPVEPAVAALVQGDKSAFYRCRFFGVQDTLWDAYGRHLYRSCTIQGAVDFIFGSAQSIYESCTISAVAAALNGKTAYITSQGKNHPQDTSGFVFKNCNIVGNGKFFLGRPWRDYARVLFYNTAMADIIEPLG